MSEESCSEVTVYWRPGCPYCAGLRARLRHLGVRTTEINIWDDPAGAATVRGLAGGNETVPTVVIRDSVMINPTGRAVHVAARRIAPESIGPQRGGRRRASSAGAVAGWAVAIVAVTASLAADATGHAAASWAFDAVAIAGYLGARVAGRRSGRAPSAPT